MYLCIYNRKCIYIYIFIVIGNVEMTDMINST